MSLVAQIALRACFPLPLTDSSYCNGLWNAKGGKAIEDDGADLNLCDLPIKVTHRKTLPQ